ncbi:MAG: TIGR04211 family SH3 domain-containing protein [Cellvibrionales bacterium]|nr:TIGR04211 family SH3 domain-containing protein [Cellvibrionales bacterium]
MTRQRLSLLLITLSSLLSTLSLAQDTGNFYIRDTLHVPVRSGESHQHRILHKGLKSGTQVKVIQHNEESGWSEIQFYNGQTGWIPTQYLVKEPTSEHKLKAANKQIATLKADLGPTGEKLLTLEKENARLTQSLDSKTADFTRTVTQYDNLKKLSENAIKMEADYQKQLVANENNQIKIDALTIENERLKSELKNNDFIMGAAVLTFGILLAFFLQWLVGRRKKRSEWR